MNLAGAGFESGTPDDKSTTLSWQKLQIFCVQFPTPASTTQGRHNLDSSVHSECATSVQQPRPGSSSEEIVAAWSLLPESVRSALGRWRELPEPIRNAIEALLNESG